MELSKEQMKLVIAKLEGSYNSKTFADENLQEIEVLLQGKKDN